MFKKTAKIILAITLTVSSFQFIGTTNAYAKENPKSTSEIDSFSVSLAIGPISVTYSPASSSSGFGVQADSSRPSRPVIYGDVLKTKYKAELRRRVTDELINTYYNTNLTGINTEIQIEYQ